MMHIQQVPLYPASVEGPTQRWRDRKYFWKQAHPDDGFKPWLYEVAAIPESLAKPFIIKEHYSGTYPAAILLYGLFCKGVLVGVAVLGSPIRCEVLTSVFPGLQPYVASMELSRFVLLTEVPGNGESWFVARVWELAAKEGLRGVVSFSDPTVRYKANGDLLCPGHVGTVYQASNALYLGTTQQARYAWTLPDGRVLHDRTLQKIRSGERGHVYSEALLVEAGATPLRNGEDRATWLIDSLAMVGARKERQEKKHRYVFTLGTRRERRAIVIRGTALPYPKHTLSYEINSI